MNRANLALLFPPFLVLAVLNSGGYRYGASDQAFYLPVVLARLDPMLFPRDAAVIGAQARLTAYDDVIALLVRTTGVSLPVVFAVLHVLSLALIAWGVWSIGRRLYRTHWACVALLAAMTLRHAVAQSGTNTLEGYFHPRQFAFGLGIVAVAMFLRGRLIAAFGLVAAAGLLHPTAALWFAIWLATAALVANRAAWRWLAIGALPLIAAVAWAVVSGPLEGRLAVMDDRWLWMLRTKEYLFILGWPAYAWIFNLGSVAIVASVYRWRQRAGLLDERERALAVGIVSLAVAFLLFVVLQAMHVVLAFQLQPARLFLMFDLLATVYAVWALAEGPMPRVARARAVALAIAAFSIARGMYGFANADRPLVQLTIPDDDWGRAMAWARTTDKGSGWLADPMHAVTYGTSVRVAGERDVFVEGVKDAALGIYDRAIAERTETRMQELNDFRTLSAQQARDFAARYNLDYLVTENVVDLPLAFESGAIKVYRIR